MEKMRQSKSMIGFQLVSQCGKLGLNSLGSSVGVQPRVSSAQNKPFSIPIPGGDGKTWISCCSFDPWPEIRLWNLSMPRACSIIKFLARAFLLAFAFSSLTCTPFPDNGCSRVLCPVEYSAKLKRYYLAKTAFPSSSTSILHVRDFGTPLKSILCSLAADTRTQTIKKITFEGSKIQPTPSNINGKFQFMRYYGKKSTHMLFYN